MTVPLTAKEIENMIWDVMRLHVKTMHEHTLPHPNDEVFITDSQGRNITGKITQQGFDELVRDAQKWREAQKSSVPNPLVLEWKEKAKKWDESHDPNSTTVRDIIRKNLDLDMLNKRYVENAPFWFYICGNCGHHKNLHNDIGSCLQATAELNKRDREYVLTRCYCVRFKEAKEKYVG